MFIKAFVRLLNSFSHPEQHVIVVDKREVREKIDLKDNHLDCPICLEELNFHKEHKDDYYEGSYTINTWSCRNKCYKKVKETCENYYDFYIFGEKFRIGQFAKLDSSSSEEVWRKINYWVSRQRYIMKWLEGEDN